MRFKHALQAVQALLLTLGRIGRHRESFPGPRELLAHREVLNNYVNHVSTSPRRCNDLLCITHPPPSGNGSQKPIDGVVSRWALMILAATTCKRTVLRCLARAASAQGMVFANTVHCRHKPPAVAFRKETAEVVPHRSDQSPVPRTRAADQPRQARGPHCSVG